MLVRELIKGKKGKPLTVGPETTIAEVAATLGKEHIGALLVQDDSRNVVGIISERDVARAVADRGKDLPDMKVKDLMTKEVRFAGAKDSVEDLMRLMTEYRIRHLPVVDGGELKAVISIGDVVRHRLTELESETSELHDYIAGGR